MSEIARLNDLLRKTMLGGKWLLTSGVNALPEDQVAEVIMAVRTFNNFNADNDPFGERDFGKIEIGGYKFYWKVDYYDKAMEFASNDPSDPAVTCRVITVMLADEY